MQRLSEIAPLDGPEGGNVDFRDFPVRMVLNLFKAESYKKLKYKIYANTNTTLSLKLNRHLRTI